MRKNHDHDDTAQPDPELLGRRTLLRRAGTIAALAGGAAVVQAGGPLSADAASGDPLTLGTANTSGTTPTSVTSAATSGPTLTVANTSTGTSARGPLVLPKSDDTIFTSTALVEGELFVGGLTSDLWYVDNVSAPDAALVFTEVTANQVVGIKPVRVLDTRSAPSRALVVLNPSVLDASGRQRANTWMQIDMTSLAIFFESAFVNLTAVLPTAAGFLSIAPAPPAGNGSPATSNLNYAKAVTLANAAVAPTVDGTVWIYTHSTTHVLLDVNALNLPSSGWLLVPTAGDAPNNAHLRAAFNARRQARSSG